MQVEAYEGEEMILNMGPQHPSTHGVLRLELQTDGEVVQKITPHIGYLHRCFEKHAENVDYPGVIPYTDRMDYIASMNNSLGYALAVEKLMGIEVNERVKTLRKTDLGSDLDWNPVSNENGEWVASGLYLFVIKDSVTGEKKTGKIIVIR